MENLQGPAHHEHHNREPMQSEDRRQTLAVQKALENIHREMIEFMTEGTHPHMAPRADHG